MHAQWRQLTVLLRRGRGDRREAARHRPHGPARRGLGQRRPRPDARAPRRLRQRSRRPKLPGRGHREDEPVEGRQGPSGVDAARPVRNVYLPGRLDRDEAPLDLSAHETEQAALLQLAEPCSDSTVEYKPASYTKGRRARPYAPGTCRYHPTPPRPGGFLRRTTPPATSPSAPSPSRRPGIPWGRPLQAPHRKPGLWSCRRAPCSSRTPRRRGGRSRHRSPGTRRVRSLPSPHRRVRP